MDSEVRIHGENGVDEISAGRADAAGVWAAAWDSTEHADLVAASVSACRRAGERSVQEGPRQRCGGVDRGAPAGESSEKTIGCGDRAAQRTSGACASGSLMPTRCSG